MPKNCSEKLNRLLPMVVQLRNGHRPGFLNSSVVLGLSCFLSKACRRSLLWRVTSCWNKTSVAHSIYRVQMPRGLSLLPAPFDVLLRNHSMSTPVFSYSPAFILFVIPILHGEKQKVIFLSNDHFDFLQVPTVVSRKILMAVFPFSNHRSHTVCFQDTFVGERVNVEYQWLQQHRGFNFHPYFLTSYQFCPISCSNLES